MGSINKKFRFCSLVGITIRKYSMMWGELGKQKVLML